MSTQNWRTEVDAEDYFGHQKKRLDLENRRPTVRGSDLVGPGIGPRAMRLLDLNDPLATFNGYFSAAVGALNAPNPTEAFIGQTVADEELGGQQVMTGLVSGNEYRRVFNRSPSDPSAIGWGKWTGYRVLPSVHGMTLDKTPVRIGPRQILSPASDPKYTEGGEDTFLRTNSGVRIMRQGVYTGYVQIGSDVPVISSVWVHIPYGDSTQMLLNPGEYAGASIWYPLTFWCSDQKQAIAVTASHQTAGDPINFWYRFALTRLGDAV